MIASWTSTGCAVRRSKAPGIDARGRVSVPNGKVGSKDKPAYRTSQSYSGKNWKRLDWTFLPTSATVNKDGQATYKP